MIDFRDRMARGASRTGWLESRHTFSFADYRDPQHMGFRSLRVINEDRVVPGAGFPTHGHQNMEIISYVLEGTLEHRDSLGHGTRIGPGEVQRMSAGTGIRHSEFNPSSSEPVHFLQIWIIPSAQGLTPRYAQKAFPLAQRRSRLRLVAFADGADGSLTVHQDARLYIGNVHPGEKVQYAIGARRGVWVQVGRGIAALNGIEMRAGDGAALEEESTAVLEADTDAEVLLFDLGR
ncbi:MAG: pirin family protein [Steroidobacteraceae bacterium]